MADNTNIEWADATWQPTLGCKVHSPGCKHCYAMKMAARHQAMCLALGRASPYDGLTEQSKAGPVWNGTYRQAEQHALTQPLRWKKPRRIFVDSMGDLFGEGVEDEWIDAAWGIMALSPHHTFLVLTKRPERARRYLSAPGVEKRIWGQSMEHVGPNDVWLTVDGWPFCNVWLGTSVEDQRHADERIPELLETPAAIRFLSAEPLLGPLDLLHVAPTDTGYINALSSSTGPNIDLVIVGGESGHDRRDFDPQWARDLLTQCRGAGVKFFGKQWDKVQPLPEDLMVREMPGA